MTYHFYVMHIKHVEKSSSPPKIVLDIKGPENIVELMRNVSPVWKNSSVKALIKANRA